MNIYTLTTSKFDRENMKFSETKRYFNNFTLAKKAATKSMEDDVTCYISTDQDTEDSGIIFVCRMGIDGEIEITDYRKERLPKAKELSADEVEALRTKSISFKDWSILSCYILMTTKYREGEEETWRNLSKEMKPDGSPEWPAAASNAEFWKETSATLSRLVG